MLLHEIVDHLRACGVADPLNTPVSIDLKVLYPNAGCNRMSVLLSKEQLFVIEHPHAPFPVDKERKYPFELEIVPELHPTVTG